MEVEWKKCGGGVVGLGLQGIIGQWCSIRDTQVYVVHPLAKVKDFRIPT